MPKCISVDAGSSALKIYDGETVLSFPAIVMADAGEHGRTHHPEAILVDGAWHLCGEAPRVTASHPYFELNADRDYHGSDKQHVQMCHAFERMGVRGDYDGLLVSLPYNRHGDAALRETLSSRTHFAWQNAQGEGREVNFGAVQTTPQGVGAMRLHQHESVLPDEVDALVAVDVGSCTTDIVTVRRQGGRWRFVDGACGSIENVSVGTFYDAWHEQVMSIGGLRKRTLDYFTLMDMAVRRDARGGMRLQHYGEAIDLTGSFARVAADFTRTALARIEATVGGWWPRAVQVILTGGGAQLLRMDQVTDPRMQVLPPDANVRGQHLHATREAPAHAAA